MHACISSATCAWVARPANTAALIASAAKKAGNFVNEFPKWRKTAFENLVTAHAQPYNGPRNWRVFICTRAQRIDGFYTING
jgi:hypothetical protein